MSTMFGHLDDMLVDFRQIRKISLIAVGLSVSRCVRMCVSVYLLLSFAQFVP